VTAELQGAHRNAETAKVMTNPGSAERLLADAILMLIQHIEKYYETP
jgi:hypothetical protein